MSKLFNYYQDNIDHTWYKSSNIKYSECIDNDNALKTLRIVFNNGTQYEYENVDVRDYLIFRDSDSQGKALNRLIKEKKYEYKKLDNVNVDVLEEEYQLRSGNAYFINNEETFEITNNKGISTFKLDKTLDEDTLNLICDVLEALDIKINFAL